MPIIRPRLRFEVHLCRFRFAIVEKVFPFFVEHVRFEISWPVEHSSLPYLEIAVLKLLMS